jgi:hypothetical protein
MDRRIAYAANSSLWQHVGAVGAAAIAESATYGTVSSNIGVSATVT